MVRMRAGASAHIIADIVVPTVSELNPSDANTEAFKASEECDLLLLLQPDSDTRAAFHQV